MGIWALRGELTHQKGEQMSRNNGLIPILLEEDPSESAITAFAGLLPYLDLWNALGMPLARASISAGAKDGWIGR